MKVSNLLKEKKDLESKVKEVNEGLRAVNNEFAINYNYKDRGGIRMHCGNQSINPVIDRDILKTALESQLTRLNEELSPVADKLAAIEMMLNS